MILDHQFNWEINITWYVLPTQPIFLNSERMLPLLSGAK